ncbi:unnamed protein product [Mytilus coruscus]|uniref:DUF6570 domain-containing protein n=1 Tax=Mytilus coruscus TaxID=42192 RepID=A0A6J8C2Y7_MYTCO|nr:unnamed protein product [Mytilus coruscus]
MNHQQNQTFVQFEQAYNKTRRSDPKYVQYEQHINKTRRADPNFIQFEQAYNKTRRSDPKYVQYEQHINKTRRADPNFIQFEQAYNKTRRSDPKFVQFEKYINKTRRADPKFVQFEKHINKTRRADPKFVQFEKHINKTRRADPKFVRFELNHTRKRRLDPAYCDAEKDYNKIRRLNSEYKKNEQFHDIQRKRSKNIYNQASVAEQLIEEFNKDISTACNYICTCCEQLWFKESVVGVYRACNISEPLYSQCIRQKSSFDGSEYLCLTCLNTMKKKKLPTLAIYNKLNFPEKPDVLNLNSLEEKLVAPVSTFFQMRELPSGGQHGILGNVVNVPADNLSTVKMLPRHLSQSQTIPVKLKRRLRYKSHVMFENIRPNNCIAATEFLLQKPLFETYVTDGLDKTWLQSHTTGLDNTWEKFIKKERVDCPTEKKTTQLFQQ